MRSALPTLARVRRALPAVALAALLVLAGCSGLDPAPESGPDQPTTTETPVYPPGVTEAGLADADALLAAHRESVREHGAVTDLRVNMTGRVDNRTVTVGLEERWRASAGLARVRHTWRQTQVTDGESTLQGRVAMYVNESHVLTRETDNGTVTATSKPRDDSYDELLLTQVSGSLTLEGAFGAANFSVVNTERRGDRWVTTLGAYDETFTDDGRTLFTATVEVAASGRVLSLSVTRDPHANRPAGQRTTRVTWANGTAVDPPDWAA